MSDSPVGVCCSDLLADAAANCLRRESGRPSGAVDSVSINSSQVALVRMRLIANERRREMQNVLFLDEDGMGQPGVGGADPKLSGGTVLERCGRLALRGGVMSPRALLLSSSASYASVGGAGDIKSK